MNNNEIKKVEEAFKTCFQTGSGESLPGPEWQRNLMISIRAVGLPLPLKITARQEAIIWRLAWTSLAASLVLAAVFSFSFSQADTDDSLDNDPWGEKVFVINDTMQE